MKKFVLFNCSLIALLILSCTPREKHDLALNLEVGNTYILEQETSQQFKQKFMGMDVDMNHLFKVVYSLYVREYDEKRYVLDFEYRDITMDVEGSGISMAVSSERIAGADDTLSKIFNAFTGKPFTVGLTKHGEVDFVNGIEGFFDLVIAELEFIDDDDEREAIDAFDQFIGEGGFKDNISQLTNYLPGKPVSLRQRWENEHIQSNMGFVGKWKNEWRLTEINDDKATVIGVSNFSLLQDEELDEPAGLMYLAQYGMDIEMDGEQETDHVIDRATGLIKQGTVNAKMDGYFKIGEGDNAMNIPISFEITSKIRLIE